MTADTPLLFQPLTIRGVTMRNRIVVSPMCQYASVEGGPSDWHLVHLGKFAMGGAGIVFGEETSVEARGRKTYGCAGIYSDAHVPAYRRINEFLKEQKAVPAIQLGHSGRKAGCRPPWEGFAPLDEKDALAGRPGWPGLAPSPIPTSEKAMVPHEMDEADIAELLASWREAALRSADAGFEICEVHGAHGYLIQQFLSPITNHRKDGYGGDRAGRMRLALEIVETVRAAWPDDKPLFFRVSAIDGQGGHWDLDDTVVLAKELKERGVDVVDCSSGGISGPLTMSIVPRVPGYQVPFAEAVKKEAGILTQAVGLITEPQHAEAILQEGKADLIALARELLADPNWPFRAAQELGLENAFDLLPHSYSWWLRRREDIRAASREAAGSAA
ncbi:NADH:flavin oxidoreductase/NADH oxidase [Afifella sp. IM 167]|uniref:NADH:flavin oxidoreductase/NADH oxidase n=1 Tax=Afifella sp. IM 167 TaxID=2033586 RepID=UPI001CCB197F|nr:NADH:flavin oxidoreductase/NADH oxidase [Afifella sp. IM 167]MBZ8135409.1 NADH:flavin oxidoreductase / NADH oxidase [Afifella sp. IM 167]